MQSNKIKNNSLYDNFFLTHTFDSLELKKAAQTEIAWIVEKTKVSREARILDVACGTGRHLLGLVNRGYRPYGVDFSTECVRMAKKNCPLIADNITEDDFLNFT